MTTDLRQQLQDHLAGRYTLERELGGGGMARVYVADDDSLRRKVVVKVLASEMAQGMSVERFKREIQLAARLQHPHIVPLLSAGELPDGALYYTMPFVDGESLRQRLERDGALPITDVTAVLRDTASALSYAHAQGVVHRDIKPANILLAHGGAVVADFGIAKALHAARGEHPADGRRSTTLTQRGTSLGTPAYMSPEQAAGDVVDHRADLYALGVVAYEMLAGRPPFDDRSAQRLLAAHASEAPEPLGRRRPNVPTDIAALVMQLLEKQPADRPQTANDVLRALENGGERLSTLATRRPPRVENRGLLARARDPLVLALVAATLVASIGWLLARRAASRVPAPVHARVALDLPRESSPSPSGGGHSLTLSPDGSMFVYRGGSPPRLYLRRLNDLTTHPLTNLEDVPSNPQFSPDGKWIAFLSQPLATVAGESRLKKIPVNGGAATLIVPAAGRFTWAPDGSIVFTRLAPDGGLLGGLWRVAPGDTAIPITSPDSTLEGSYGSPAVMPDGKTVLFTAVSRRRPGEFTLAAVHLGSTKVIPLGIAGGNAMYFDAKHLLFAQPDGRVAAIPFDFEHLRATGDPVVVLDSVAMKNGLVAELALSANGTLAYFPGTIGSQVVLVDRRGGTRLIIPEVRSYNTPRVSPDGRRILLAIGQPPYTSDIWIYDTLSTTLTRLTTDGRSNSPEWSVDGRRVAWTRIEQPRRGAPTVGTAIWWQPWDQSAPPELLIPGAGGARFTPSGDAALATIGTEVRLIPLPFDSTRPGRTILTGSVATEPFYRISPDGRWLAFSDNQTGVREIYVQPLPGPGGRYPISAGGGAAPRWSPDGKEVFYRSGCCLIAATVALTAEPTVVRRDTLFAMSATRSMYDVTHDGRYFVMARVSNTSASPIIAFGWADEVRELLRASEKR